MDKEIYKYLKDEDVIGLLADDIVEAFKTKMNKDTVDYSFDIAQGTGKIKIVEQNTFFSFDTEDGSTLEKFKKALFDDDLEGLTQAQEAMLIEDVGEYLKEVAVAVIEKYGQDVRDNLRKNIMPKSKPEDFPFERIFITSIDIADFSSFGEPQKHLLRIGKKPGAFINTDVVIQYVQNRQEETGMTPNEILEESHREENPIFAEITDIEQGEKYLYDIAVSMFVDYSLAEKSMEELSAIREKELKSDRIEKVHELIDDVEEVAEEERRQKLIEELKEQE